MQMIVQFPPITRTRLSSLPARISDSRIAGSPRDEGDAYPIETGKYYKCDQDPSETFHTLKQALRIKAITSSRSH